MTEITIRPQRPDDYEEILKLTYNAFLTLDYPGRRRMDEHFLMELLQGSPFVIPSFCFVAELSGKIVGHILYTTSEIATTDGVKIDTVTFGPLSVAPANHRQGIGAALVAHSMDAARALGYGAVVITGVPDYYPKLGFRRGREYGLVLEDGSAPDAFMVYELLPGTLCGGTAYFHPPEFEQCETDDAGYEAFHKDFMAAHFPEQITLRPLWDADVTLMERWLYLPHVAKWYEHPSDWLNEINSRRDNFRFLFHFIAEYEGTPIGFGQYYDCFFAKEHETWDEQWPVGDKPGEIFSIDYLIGEPEYLQKGYGKEIVRLLTEKVRTAGGAQIIVEPHKENAASIRALEANGFRYADDNSALAKHL